MKILLFFTLFIRLGLCEEDEFALQTSDTSSGSSAGDKQSAASLEVSIPPW
jgi:hypothetical protein